MCIIALKPDKVELSKDQMRIMWDNNPHGAGFMHAVNGKVLLQKGFLTLDDLWDAIQAVGPLQKMVIHFRIRTHGAQNAEMTHPFWVKEGKLAMVHNGVIRPLTHLTTSEISDTAIFARKIAENYSNPITAVKNPFHRDMLETYIGNSKMVFMDGKGQTYILNEHFGDWHRNVWYSNQKYKPMLPQESLEAHLSNKRREVPVPPLPPAPRKKSKRSREETSLETPEEKPTQRSPQGQAQRALMGLPNHWDRIPDKNWPPIPTNTTKQ